MNDTDEDDFRPLKHRLAIKAISAERARFRNAGKKMSRWREKAIMMRALMTATERENREEIEFRRNQKNARRAQQELSAMATLLRKVASKIQDLEFGSIQPRTIDYSELGHLAEFAEIGISVLTDLAKSARSEKTRSEAGRWLYFLTRDLSFQMRDICETRPEWFAGIADKNECAPWLIRDGEDLQSEARQFLNLVKIGAKLPPKSREFSDLDRREKPFAFLATAIFRLIQRHRTRKLPPPDYSFGQNGKAEERQFVPDLPDGKKIEDIIKEDGWREATRFLPAPSKNRSSQEFKMWWPVAWQVYLDSNSRSRRYKHVAREMFTKTAHSYKDPYAIENTKVRDGLAAAFTPREKGM